MPMPTTAGRRSRSSTNSGTQRIAIVRSSTDQKTAQYVDISCATTSFDDDPRNQPHGVPLMAYTQAHLDALEAALVKGEKRVTFGDKTVEYRSVDELQAAIAAVKRDLFEQAVDTGLWPGAPRQIRVTTGKGF
jgi:hypothetical protein